MNKPEIITDNINTWLSHHYYNNRTHAFRSAVANYDRLGRWKLVGTFEQRVDIRIKRALQAVAMAKALADKLAASKEGV